MISTGFGLKLPFRHVQVASCELHIQYRYIFHHLVKASMEHELALVERVDLRLALAESDTDLQTALHQFLLPLLLKLASPHPPVRQAVFKTIQNVFPRITASRLLQLPVDALVEQLILPNVGDGIDTSQVRLYLILFLSKGVERISTADQVLTVVKLARTISSFSGAVLARVFALIVKLLADWMAPESERPEAEKLATELDFAKNKTSELVLSQKITKFFFLQPNASSAVVTAPGLSIQDINFFTKDAGVAYKTTAEIKAAKMALLEFLKVGFSDLSLFLPLLVASVDSTSLVADAADSRLRKLTFDCQNEKDVLALVKMFTGDGNTLPVKPHLQDKILQLINKSSLKIDSKILQLIANMGLLSDYARLRLSTVNFIRLHTKSESESPDAQFSESVASKLKENLMKEGWPELATSLGINYNSAILSRQLQYEALGDVLRNAPSLWHQNLDYLVFMLESLEGDLVDVKPTIQDALLRLSVHLPSLSSIAKAELKLILRRVLSTSDPKTSLMRYIAVKFVCCTYDFEDAEARILCLQGSASFNYLDTVEEARRGLNPYYFRLLNASNSLAPQSLSEFSSSEIPLAFPSFQNLIHAVSRNMGVLSESIDETLRFAFRVFVTEAVQGKKTVIATDENWEARVDNALETDELVRSCVSDYIKNSSDDLLESFNTFLSLLLSAIYEQHFGNLRAPKDFAFETILRLLLSLSTNAVTSRLVPSLEKILKPIMEVQLRATLLKEACEIFGIIASHENLNKESINNLCSNLNLEKEQELLAASFVLSRLYLRERTSDVPVEFMSHYLSTLVEKMKVPKYYDVSLECVIQLLQFGSLALEVERVGEFISLVEQRAKSCHELSVLALAALALSLPETYEQRETLTAQEAIIIGTHISKQIEFLFASGEALLILACGWQSMKLISSNDIMGTRVTLLPPTTGRLPVILKEVLKACASTKPALRRAGCLWLLSLVMFGKHLPLIKEKATEIHLSFMRFLADRDEILQESASRGLTFVYELGDADLKETLVKGLLRSFTETKSTSSLMSGSVGLDTEIFDENVLRTDDGSVSTYKDVLALASDVGDPALVYKFMSLARSNALWSSRRGIAFGLSSILSKLSLEDMLANNPSMANRLIPKLFRYRFDPNANVARSMNEIWQSLIADTSKATTSYFEPILQEALRSMGHKEWRVRQAGSSALGSLLQSQRLETYESKLEEIWAMTFRSMDDIKESVRKEGNNLAKALANILMRTADSNINGSSRASAVLDELIPFFLSGKGILSDAEDVRNFSLETLLKLCKNGGPAVRKHVPELLGTFIELMSSLEPEVVNYLVLNADKFNLKSSDVDAQRLQSLGSSPLLEAVERLLDLVNEEIMPQIITQLQKSVKRSVGLPSKACGSKVIASLIQKHYFIIKPYGDRLLALSSSQLRDRSAVIASSYAAAAGYSCKVASLDSAIQYVKDLGESYCEEEDQRNIVAVALESVAKYSSHDRFEALAPSVLPLVFLGTHDSDSEVKEIFDRVWIDSSSGSAAVRLYLSEILEICSVYLKSSNFGIRQVIARSLFQICNSVAVTSERDLSNLFDLLVEANNGRSWEGKELIFDALVELSIQHSTFHQSRPDQVEKINRIAKVEASRRNKAYQSKAVISLGKYLRTYPDGELVSVYCEVMGSVLSEDYFDDMEEDDRSKIKTAKLEEKYFPFIESIFLTAASNPSDESLLSLLDDSIQLYNKRVADQTWNSCFAINSLLLKILQAILNQSSPLDAIQKETLIKLIQTVHAYKSYYRLEKCAVLLAKNTKMFLTIMEEANMKADSQFAFDFLNDLRHDETSTVVLNEYNLALEAH